MPSKKGYPLPVGEVYTDDFSCQLVFIPNKDEYWQAILGAILYMGTWKAWERDDDKRGKDAAQAWREANELTLECWRMTTCLQDITSRMDLMLALMAARICCDAGTVSYDSTVIIATTIVPGVGDDPDVYGETAVADWQEWYEHLCYQAHAYVDRLIQYANTIHAIFNAGSLTLDTWASILDALMFVGLPIPFYIADAMEWLSDILSGGVFDMFADAAADLEDARDSIVCAFMQDTAVEDAVGSGSSWTLFYQLINYDNVKAILYEGGYDGDYLPAETKDDCWDCDLEQLFEGDVFITIRYGGNLLWNEAGGFWQIQSTNPAACQESQVWFWEDAEATIRKACHVEVISCNGTDSLCQAPAANHAGNLWGQGGFDWEVNHPDLPTPDLSAVDILASRHNNLHQVQFKLYE